MVFTKTLTEEEWSLIVQALREYEREHEGTHTGMDAGELLIKVAEGLPV